MLEHRLTKRFRGRELIVSRLSAKAKRECRDPQERFSRGQAAVRARSEMMARAGTVGRIQIEREAAAEKRRRDAATHDEVNHLKVRKRMEEDRHREAAQEAPGIRNVVDSFRLQPHELDEFDDIFATQRDDRSFDELESQFAGSPLPPPREHRDRMRQDWPDSDTEGKVLPEFVRHICRNREQFVDVIVFEGEDGEIPQVVWLVGVASKSPHQVVWLRLERTYDGAMDVHSHEDFQIIHPRAGANPRFRITGDFCVDDEANTGARPLWVIDIFEYTGVYPVIRCLSRRAIPWEYFCRFHVVPSGGSGRGGALERRR